MPQLTVRYDLRLPPFATTTSAEQYAACVEQAAWADARGFSSVVLSEHHATDVGFLPAPLPMAAAVAARTSELMVCISALLVPLHDPLRLAEDIAVVDLVAGGRLCVVLGLGYRDEEFEMFGVDRRTRAAALEEAVAVMRRAWTGEPFEHRGRRAQVTPKPFRREPLMFVGGSTDAAARRAARLRLGFWPAIGDPELEAAYRTACAEEGWAGGISIVPTGPGFVHVTDDPERAWEQIGPHALHDAQTYAAWQRPGQRSSVHVEATTIEDVKASGVYRIVTPDECVALARELGDAGGLVFHPLMGGMDPALGWESLELFDAKVRPRL